jgi:hypothetical protein
MSHKIIPARVNLDWQLDSFAGRPEREFKSV